ncbi:unnamed protein product [Medioppia subpectinata]|uniref:C2H2-type domain-containing protein n=1 Tax=Medioppia subpectinata TaxID=1979941 RepID=A0A7R9KXJ1_9ACAR|nr:unnamed protein product [Medioppia subpectinata]CAG2111685.1 unnamed protein product [Medioppia subpectinata]
MNATKSLFDRQIGSRGCGRRSVDAIDSAFSKLSLCRQYLFTDLNDVGAPPLALALNHRLLSVANDGGDVALLDKSDLNLRHKWTAHNNAIFDIKWRPEFDHHLGTASGDKSISVWDINKGGSVIVIESAHLSKLPAVKSSPRVKPQRTSPLNSVTCVAFNGLTDHLYSSGANDATIKLWDLRKCRRNKLNKTSSTPFRELYQTSRRGTPSHGFTCLTFDSKNRLFASCSDHNSYDFAHNGSIKSIGFKDENVLASGSRDGLIKIWDLRCGRGGSVIVIESAHLSKLPAVKSSPRVKPQRTSPLNSVTCVAFNGSTDHLYSSGANDATIKLWDLRKCRRNKLNKTSSTPFRELYQTSRRGTPSHGFTCLTFDSKNRFYEELVKQLKPCSVSVERIDSQELPKLKVISDPNRIKDEVLPEVHDADDLIEEEEVDVVLAEVEAQPIDISEEDNRVYKCFFCQNTVTGYAETFTHLQLHIDYFPIQCSICDEALTDVISFVKHCRKCHPELENAKYIKKFNSKFHDWIHNFLTAEPNQLYKDTGVFITGRTLTELFPRGLQLLGLLWRRVRNFGDVQNAVSRKKKPKADTQAVILNTATNTVTLTNGISKSLVPLHNLKPNASANKLQEVIKQKPVTLDSLMASLSSAPQMQAVLINGQITLINTLDSLMASLSSAPQMQAVLINGQITLINTTPTAAQMHSPLLFSPSSNSINANPFPVEAAEISVVCVDPNEMEVEERNFKYICIFCEQKPNEPILEFVEKSDALIHYAIHFNYNPIVCMICDKSFVDLSLLMSHYTKEHNAFKNHLFHYFKEDERIEKWILSFLDFQRNFEFRGKVSAVVGDSCFVCNKLSKLPKDRLELEFKNVKPKEIRDHMNEHLNYFPYKCSICFHGGRDVRFSALNNSAYQHLFKIHGLDLNDRKLFAESTKLFVKCDEILDLEKYIDNFMSPNRAKLSKSTLVLNIKRKLEEIEAESKKSRLLNSTPTPALPSARVIPIVTTIGLNSMPQTYGRQSPKLSPTLSSILTAPVPSSAAFQRQLQYQTNGIKQPIRAIAPKQHPIEVLSSRQTYIEPFLMCFHCHEKVLNALDLESHHMKKHPKLTIASYTPNKAEITSIARRSLESPQFQRQFINK